MKNTAKTWPHKTWSQKPAEAKKAWRLIDASGRPLGRLASEAAKLLIGKGKPGYTPHVAGGDYVLIINSDKVALTGKKWTDKKYYSRSRYIGSLKERAAKDLKTEDLIQKAVKGMLPKNKHRALSLKRLRIFKGAEHPFADKKPLVWSEGSKEGLKESPAKGASPKN